MDDKPGPTLQAKAAEDFDGSHPLIVFDGICVLCSGFARSVVSLDRGKKFRFVIAQSPLGEALYRKYGLRTDIYETNIVIVDGVAYQRLDSLIAVLDALGWPWRAARMLKLMPRPDSRPAVRADRPEPLRAVRQEGELRNTVRGAASEDHWIGYWSSAAMAFSAEGWLRALSVRPTPKSWSPAGRGTRPMHIAARLAAHRLLLDRDGDIFGEIARLAPSMVIDAAGPFQAYGDDPYRVAKAAIAAGAHYIDLADDSAFVAGIATLDARAQAAGVAVISGASSVPAISAAALDELVPGLASVAVVGAAILPGNRAPRGLSVVRDYRRTGGPAVAAVARRQMERGAGVGRYQAFHAARPMARHCSTIGWPAASGRPISCFFPAATKRARCDSTPDSN